ncbi:MAG TPA: Ig-like domain-containing protein, partial [Rariglobus sp.]
QGINEEITAEAGLVARWSLDEGTGTTVSNSGLATATGTLVNGPAWIAGSPFDAVIVPEVAFTAPANGALFDSPATFELLANATDGDGTVVRVDFFRDGELIGTDGSAPYAISQNGLSSGVYHYTAQAIDNDGNVVTSDAVIVTVNFDADHPPANTALRFDGVDDYVTMGVAPELGLGGPPSKGMTIECWFRRDGDGIVSSSGSGGVSGVPLFGKGRGEDDGSAIDCDYFFGIDASGHLVADFETYPATGLSTGLNYPVTGTHTPIQNGVWYHAAAVYDGNAAMWKLYLDGVEVGSAATAAGSLPRYDSIQHFGIATAMNSGGEAVGAFAGIIDEVRLWNYARSVEEIAADRSREIASAPGLVGRYGLNEATGSTVSNTVDAAGGPVGTIVGNPNWVDGAPFSTANTAPTAALVTPDANATTMFPYVYTFTATATDVEGTVARVEFYVDGQEVGEDTTAPYSLDWTPPAVGTYNVLARAVDDLGGVGSSAVIAIEVTANPNTAPVVTATFPAAGATGAGESTALSVNVADPENDGTTVTFYGRKTTPPVPGPDFVIGTLPDTQYYSENNGGTRFQQFLDQTNWYVAQRDALNIVFVSHMGDIVDDGDTIPQQWVNANEAMTKLEDHATTLRAYGIPFGASPGNHDQSTNGNPASLSSYYNQYFGVSRYQGRPYWGGNYGDNNDNNYQLFSASGLDFIIIHLEYRTAADPAVIAWADALLKAYPHRRGIVTSHWIIGGGNPAAFGGQGQGIYNGLKNNPNLFLLLCGHIHAEGRRSDVFEGRTVYSCLQDYQGSPDGGSGFLRYFRFSPANNLITAISYSPTLGRAPNANDSIPGFQGTYTMAYDMQSTTSEWIPLGTATVAPGGTVASINWTGLEPGAHYEWYADAFDGINHASSASRRLSTASAQAPSITLTAPVDGLTYTGPATLALQAIATDADGTVSRVDFFQGTTKLGEDTTAPYTFATAQLAPGNYTFSAVAVDNAGDVKLSNLVSVVVADRIGTAPTVALSAPLGDTTVQVPGSIALAADATDADGGVAKVAFYADGALLGEDATAPFALNWASALPGSHVLTAVATDNDGQTATSDPVTIQVAFTPEASAVDADGDLIGRLMEHALGLAENEPNRAGLPELGTAAEGGLTLTFRRAVAGLAYTVQASDDLEVWSDLSVNAGTVGELVTVTDANTTSPNRYLRLKVSDGVSTQSTTPVGRLTHTLTTARETSMAFPLLLPVGTVTGHPAGVISAVGATTLDDAQAGWAAGAFSQPETPYIVRI